MPSIPVHTPLGFLGFAVLPDPSALGQPIEYDFDDLEVRAQPTSQ